MSVPRVSVVLPVYNGLELLKPALASITAQTFEDFELLVIDDGSTEPVADFIGGLRDSRVRFASRPNRGLGATLNELLRMARGEYIARMDADDIALPGRLGAQVEALDHDRSLSIVGCQIAFLVAGHLTGARRFPVEHAGIRAELLEGRFPLCHPAVMFRREAATAVGGYRLDGAGEDLDFFLRITEQGRSANVDQVLFHYRLVEHSLSIRKRGELQLGYAYARDCAARRAAGLPELSMQQFRVDVWASRSLLRQLGDRAEAQSEALYRRSLVWRAGNRHAAAGVALLGAAALRPGSAWRRILATLRPA